MRRVLFFVPVVIFAVLAAYFVWGLNPERNPREIPSARVGQDILPFELAPVEGMTVPGLNSANLTGEGVTLVNFFASWCIPCRAEHPLLMELAERGELRLVGINYKDKAGAARAWLDELGNPYSRIGADLSGRVGIDWGVSGVPETFIVDGNGKILHQQIGPITPQVLEEEILPLAENGAQ